MFCITAKLSKSSAPESILPTKTILIKINSQELLNHILKVKFNKYIDVYVPVLGNLEWFVSLSRLLGFFFLNLDIYIHANHLI